MTKRRNTINDDDRQQWVDNDEGLQRMWLASGKGITVWVRENRSMIDEVIKAVRDGEKPAHYLVYGGGQ